MKQKKNDESQKISQREKIKDSLSVRSLKWTEKQKQFIELATNKDTRIIFVNGPAGTSKSIIATYVSLLLLNEKKVSDIIYIRSAVESSDSKIGFLPGDASEKLQFYNLPFLEKLDELLPRAEVDKLEKDERISMYPINYSRGMSWAAKAIILDECFPGYEYVLTENGAKKIQNLFNDFTSGKSLPKLTTFNENTQEFEFKDIVKIWSNGKKEIIQVNAGNRKIHCTPNHLFLSAKGWKKAEDLVSGDILIANNHDKHQVLKCLNEDQKQIFLGSYLGDGSVSNHGANRNRLRVIHGVKQSDYCSWKANMFGSELSIIQNNGFSKKPAIRFSTKCFAFSEGDFLHDKKNHCPDWILEKLDWRGMAIWYMDDGNLNTSKNRITLYTCSFDIESQEKFVKKFKSLGIDCEVKELFYKKRNKKFLSIVFNAENTRKFLDKVSPYIHESMSYKSNNMFENKNQHIWNDKYLNYNHIVCDGIEKLNKEEEVFDLEVKDNHNFIIASASRSSSMNANKSGPVVHNCQNSTKKEIVTVLTRLGEFSRCFVLADPMQTDLPSNKAGGFEDLFHLFSDEDSKAMGIHTFTFDEEDIVRSKIVKFIVNKLKSSK